MNENGKTQLFIPSKICVGAQERQGTYTGKLAYVIYYDQKGVRRKEKSWDTWRDHKIEPQDFDNEPTEGFVLNKGVGGARQSYGWNTRNEYIRVYDPRDFEFEISVSNLLFILRECDCMKGKGLTGKFVYAWGGTDLILLPEISTDYQNSKKYTDLQAQSVKAKDLIPGASYLTKKQKTLIYLGKFGYLTIDEYHRYSSDSVITLSGEKKWIFWDTTNNKFVPLKELKSLATLNSDTIVDNFAELVEKYRLSPNATKVVRVFTKEVPPPGETLDNWVTVNADGTWTEYNTIFHYDYAGGKYLSDKTKIERIRRVCTVEFKDNVLKVRYQYAEAYPPSKNIGRGFYYPHNDINYVEPTRTQLYVELESGAQFLWQNGKFSPNEKE